MASFDLSSLATMANLFSRRFTELLVQSDELLKTKRNAYSQFSGASTQVDDHLFLGWKVKTKNLLEKACGLESQHFKQFEQDEVLSWTDSFERARKLRAIFEAAQEDYDGGYLNSVRTIVQAEVFDSELEQA